MSDIIPFRLRVGKDDDLASVLNILPAHIEKSDIIREALRMYFFNAPTPFRDSLDYVLKNGYNLDQTLIKVRVPREPKAVKQTIQPQLDKPKLDMDFTSITPVIKDDVDIESKLNKSLGL
jgi:hypothetical protein